jgi:hypothetical protein
VTKLSAWTIPLLICFLVSEYVRMNAVRGFENIRVQWRRSLTKPPVDPVLYLGLVTSVGRGLRSLMRGPHLAAADILIVVVSRWMP